MKTARYWHMRTDGLIECELCPRHCRIPNFGNGFCFVRQRIGDELFAASYEMASGMAIDPIEKKPLCHFLPHTRTLSFGTIGCNLGCKFCQNSHLTGGRQFTGRPTPPKTVAEVALRNGCKSVAFTYNEPSIFLEYAVDTAIECHKLDLKTVAVSNGWIESEPRREFYDHMDAANIDLKAFTDEFYQDMCSASLQSVLDTLTYIANETSVHLEVTTLLIPGKNDSEEEIDAMTQWAVENLSPDTPWHFTAYRPTERWHEAPPTPLATLKRAEQIAMQNGLTTIHLGNLGIAT
ncbi:MAG: AmmeMemoRadiSam system radical SAM enzyme [Kiritimatiellales bacterium]